VKPRKKPFKDHLWSGKPYNFFGDYLRKKYGKRLLKLPIDAGLGCPNRDGTISTGGCTFCSEYGSASPVLKGTRGIINQMERSLNSFIRTEQDTSYIAYFQSYTNTYGSIEKLRELYDTAISFPMVTGLMVGTRPDEVRDEVLELLAGYKKPGFELWLEIGMQSSHDKSLAFLNRGHSFNDVAQSVARASEKDIPVVVHVILGIPGESWGDIMATAKMISSMNVQGVKIHHLHVIKNTVLEQQYNGGLISLLPYREYISLVTDFMERLRGDIIIHRLSGDQLEEHLVAPKWGHQKGTIQRDIEGSFHARGTYQGFLYEPNDP
jgi:uncharacterized protein